MMKKRISNREFEVLDQVSLGYTTDEIASNLFISTHTVITHRKSLCRKLKARNAPGLVRKAFESGVLTPDSISIKSATPNYLLKKISISLIGLFMFFTVQGQLTMAEIEGDLKLRGAINMHHSIDSTVMLIGYKAGAELNREIFDLLDSDGFYFPRATTLAGVSAGEFSNGVFNAFFGFQAGQHGGLGSKNAFMGFAAGNNTTRDDNVFIGFQSGAFNTVGYDNVFIGSNSGLMHTAGSYNTFIGKGAGSNTVNGVSNTFIGWQTGSRNRTGHSNTMIGDGADISSGLDSLSLAIALGYNATVGCHSCAVIGGIGEDAVKVGIGVANPVSRLHVMQQSIGPTTGMRLEVNTETDTITANMYLNLSKKLNFSIDDNRVGYIDDVTGDYVATSDARLKKDVTNLGSVMSRIMMLTPQWYRYHRNQPHARKTLGLMAQELKEYFPELVTESDGTLGVAYAKLGVLAIKGLQEQEATIEQQQEMIQEIKLEMASLKAQVAALMSNIE